LRKKFSSIAIQIQLAHKITNAIDIIKYKIQLSQSFVLHLIPCFTRKFCGALQEKSAALNTILYSKILLIILSAGGRCTYNHN